MVQLASSAPKWPGEGRNGIHKRRCAAANGVWDQGDLLPRQPQRLRRLIRPPVSICDASEKIWAKLPSRGRTAQIGRAGYPEKAGRRKSAGELPRGISCDVEKEGCSTRKVGGANWIQTPPPLIGATIVVGAPTETARDGDDHARV